jgi:hypothetical protein
VFDGRFNYVKHLLQGIDFFPHHSILVDAQGQHLWIHFRDQLVLFDVDSNVPRASFHLPIDIRRGRDRLLLDEARGWILVNHVESGTLGVLDAYSLQLLALVPIRQSAGTPWPGSHFTSSVGTGAIGAHVLRHAVQGHQCPASFLDALRTDGGSRTVQLDLIGCGTIISLHAPAEPSDLRASVQLRDVTLSWIDPGNTSDYEIDVGFAPDQVALSYRTGRVTGVSFTNVPAGRYYVRVRALNEVGSSGPSAQIEVSVP